MGVSRTGRFAVVTNYRSLADMRPGGASRGDLTRLFLAGEETALDYAKRVARTGGSYTGFNLLVSDGTELFYLSNRDRKGPIRVSAGFFVIGLSGKTRIHIFPVLLIVLLIVTRTASICRLVIHPGSSAFKPYSPKETMSPPLVWPRMRPRDCFLHFAFLGINMVRRPLGSLYA